LIKLIYNIAYVIEFRFNL